MDGGMKIRDNPCKDCGRQADPFGIHAVTCQRSGCITMGHTVLRDTVADLLAKAGVPAATEQHLPDSLNQPADVLPSSWRGRTVAVDFTIITPTRPSTRVSSTSTTTLMDQAAENKLKKSSSACQAAGWGFQPFVADSYGAMRSDARGFISHFIHGYHQRFSPLDEKEAGRTIWSSIFSAIVSRAAQQLGQLSMIVSPFGVPTNGLELRTSRMVSSTLPTASYFSKTTRRLGINPLQPRGREEAGGLFDIMPSGAFTT